MDPIYLAHLITEDVNVNNGLLLEFDEGTLKRMAQE
jgi:hypothetical protein